MLNGRETTPPPASSEVELESIPPLVDSPASPDRKHLPTTTPMRSTTTAPTRPTRKTPSATASLPEQSALPKASGSMTDQDRPPHQRRHGPGRRHQATGDGDDKDYRGVVDECSEAVVRHVRRAMNTCCMTHVADEVRGVLAY